MKVKELAEALNLVNLTEKGIDRPVRNVYACDLLSRVMSDCQEGDVWITVQTHLNVVAVAELKEAACIIIPQGIQVQEETIDKAAENDLALLSGEMSTYETCWRIHQLLS